MEKFLREYKSLIFLCIIAFVLYEMTVSNGLYVNDDAALASAIETGTVQQTYIYQSSPLYVEITLILYKVLRISPATILSQMSVIFMTFSIIPFWFILKKFFGKRMAEYATLIYIFLPFIWFNAINAKTYALSILLSNIFIYFLLFGKKAKENLIFLSILFGIISVVHTMNVFLLPMFLVYLNKNKKRIFAVMIAAISFFVIRFASGVSFFSQYSYIAGNTELRTIIFGFGLNLWALFNSFSFFTFLLAAFGVYYFVRYYKDKKLFLWALPSISLFIYGKDSISGITPVIPFLILCGIYFLTRMKDQRKIVLILAVCIIFQLVKFIPFAILIHQYPSPQQLYSNKILSITTKNDTILSGSESAWFFGKRTFYTPEDNFTIASNKTYYMTLHFITTENRQEIESLAKQIGFNPSGLNTETHTSLANKTCECQYVQRDHNFEDPYLYFTAVSPSILDRLIFTGNPASNMTYWVCKLCL